MRWPSMDREALYATLVTSKARLEPGLTEAELDASEKKYGFTFPPDLGMLLSLALPVSEGRNGFPDWRDGDEDELRSRVTWPVTGVLTAVADGRLWRTAWGPRPGSDDEAVAFALRESRRVPLIPVYAYAFLCSLPDQPGNPVLGCHETDVVYYATDLLTFLRREFPRRDLQFPHAVSPRIPFWSDLIEES